MTKMSKILATLAFIPLFGQFSYASEEDDLYIIIEKMSLLAEQAKAQYRKLDNKVYVQQTQYLAAMDDLKSFDEQQKSDQEAIARLEQLLTKQQIQTQERIEELQNQNEQLQQEITQLKNNFSCGSESTTANPMNGEIREEEKVGPIIYPENKRREGEEGEFDDMIVEAISDITDLKEESAKLQQENPELYKRICKAQALSEQHFNHTHQLLQSLREQQQLQQDQIPNSDETPGQSLVEQIQKLKRENADLQESNDELEKIFGRQLQEVNVLRQQNRELMERAEKSKIAGNYFKGESQGLRTMLNKSREDLNQSQEKVEASKKQLVQLQNEVAKITKECDEYKTKNDQFKQNQQNLEQIVEKKYQEQYQNEINQSQMEINRLKTEIATLSKDKEELSRKNTELEAKLKTSINRNQSLEEKNATLKQQLAERAKIQYMPQAQKLQTSSLTPLPAPQTKQLKKQQNKQQKQKKK